MATAAETNGVLRWVDTPLPGDKQAFLGIRGMVASMLSLLVDRLLVPDPSLKGELLDA